MSDIDFDGMKPKDRLKLFKTVCKEVKAKDLKEKLEAIKKVIDEPRYLLEGGAIVPFMESFSAKKKMLEITEGVLPFLQQYLELPADKVGGDPALEATKALILLKEDLSLLKNLVSVVCYKVEVKKPKKGETVEVDYTQQNRLRAQSVNSLAVFARSILDSGDAGLKDKFSSIPDLVPSLCAVLPDLIAKFTETEDDEVRKPLVLEGRAILTCLAAAMHSRKGAVAEFLAVGDMISHLQAAIRLSDFRQLGVQCFAALSAHAEGLPVVANSEVIADLLEVLDASTKSVGEPAAPPADAAPAKGGKPAKGAPPPVAAEEPKGDLVRLGMCSVNSIIAIFTDIAVGAGSILTPETVVPLVKNIAQCMVSSGAWIVSRAPAATPLDIDLTCFCDAGCTLFGTLGVESIGTKAAAVSAGACACLITLLTKSAEAVAWAVDEDAVDANGKAKLRALALRRAAEKALLLVSSSSTESSFTTDEDIFRVVEAEEEGAAAVGPMFIGADVGALLGSSDKDLAARAARVLRLLVLGASNPLEFSQEIGLNETVVGHLSEMVTFHGSVVYENSNPDFGDSDGAVAVESEPAAESEAEPAPEAEVAPAPVPLPEDALKPKSEETLSNVLSLLGNLLKASSENILAFAQQERFELLAKVLYCCGPTCSGLLWPELIVSAFDPRHYPYVMEEGEVSGAKEEIVLRLLVVLCGVEVAASVRAYDPNETVVPEAGKAPPVIATPSPCAAAAQLACSHLVDPCVAILLA
jgi:hypothetical protein